MSSSLSAVEQEIKSLILSDFENFPSRQHTLRYIFLDRKSTYRWVKQNNGQYTILGPRYFEDKLNISLKESRTNDNQHNDKLAASGEDFHNYVASWVTFNIDAYVSASFSHSAISLSPDDIFKLEPGFSRLCKLPKLTDIEVEWLEAIKYCAEFEMTLLRNMKQLGNDISEHLNAYKLYKKVVLHINAIEESRSTHGSRLTDDAIAKRYQNFAFKSEMFFDEFKELYSHYITSGESTSQTLTNYSKVYLNTKHTYFPKGVPNKVFEVNASRTLGTACLIARYISHTEIESQIKSQLNISSFFYKYISNFVRTHLSSSVCLP